MPNDLTTTTDQLPISSEMAERWKRDAGKGVSFKQEDQLLPLIYVLQNGSPIVDKRGGNYIDGAEPGHFWLRNSIEPIRNGEEGIIVQPCETFHIYVEWLPNRGGFVARHEAPPRDMVTKTIRGDDGRERTALVRENGNLIADTREIYLMCDGQPYVLPCTSTKHTFARKWNTMFHQFKIPGTRDIAPAFARKYKLTTIPESNALGKWFGISFQDLGWVTDTLEYDAAESFYEAVKKGERKAEAPVQEGGKDEIPF